jgi:hypothetical protein
MIDLWVVLLPYDLYHIQRVIAFNVDRDHHSIWKHRHYRNASGAIPNLGC